MFPRPLGWSHVHALCNNFLVQIVRSLSEEGRAFFKEKTRFKRVDIFLNIDRCMSVEFCRYTVDVIEH